MNIINGSPLFILILMFIPTRAIFGNPWKENVNCSIRSEDERCRCDEECAHYGDCCVTSPHFVPAQQIIGASPFICHQVDNYGVYVIGSCPEAFANYNTRSLCENPNLQNDPLLAAPVTSTRTKLTYRNWYCAACHDDLAAESTQIWLAKFDCSCHDFLPPYFTESVSKSDNVDRLRYNPDTKIWYLKALPLSGNNENGDSDCSCKLNYQAPTNISFQLRGCYRTINNCTGTWTDMEVKRECEAYTDVVCAENYMYRNPHCTICNNKERDACFTSILRAPPAAQSFSILLDWKRLKRSLQCSEGEVYDPLARICRRVYLD
ncbi:hypothetical protein C0J52_04858 [Blattella germanica]|nr:hypothetical protein C0J52_04858 [Blattella germanica]